MLYVISKRSPFHDLQCKITMVTALITVYLKGIER